MGIKEKLKNGKLVTGLWMQSGSPVVAEIMADGGMDFIAADMEHSDINEASLTTFIRALGGKTAPFARVRENSTIAIRRALDSGVAGIIVPLVNNPEDAALAVAATRYPPEGVRGYAFCRANDWGRNFDEYARNSNDDVVLLVMIETGEAVRAIDGILQVPGVDGVLIGPYDLSGSLGMPGQVDHPEVQRAKAVVLEACKRFGKVAGEHIVTPTPEAVRKAVKAGYTFLPLGMDTVFISAGVDKMYSMVQEAQNGAAARSAV